LGQLHNDTVARDHRCSLARRVAVNIAMLPELLRA
jgi:hypothetical protein